ncbi:MAG: arginine--tRNA ligase [Candidatus Woesearchaeota archaeon]|nr:MAG: arginine--tRNA ligase [Candidatus Woesearchaeota archaeon]
MDFREELIKILKKVIKEEFSGFIEIPPDKNLGDFALPCFFLAKKLKKSPHQIAQELKDKIKLNEAFEKIESVGPYLNFFVNKKYFVKEVLSEILKKKDKYGAQKQRKKVMVESPGPNTNKPLHLGHVRNILLAKGYCGTMRFLGNKVTQVDIINDRGIHIMKSILAYKKFGKNEKPKIKGDHFVGKYYILYNKKLKENPSLEKEAKELLRKWEQDDKETIKIWKLMNSWALKGIRETYKKFNLKIDKTYYESETYQAGKQMVFDGCKKGLFKEDSDGSIYINLDKDLGKKVLLRNDGTSLYITQDLYVARKRFQEYKGLDLCVYVVASEQDYHFKVLFKLLELLKVKGAGKCYHLSYGLVNLPEGKLKSREGTTVDADNLLDEMINLAKRELDKRVKLDKVEKEKRAKEIAISALTFFLLKQDTFKDILFDPNESISFEGDTGPYVQYTYARASSILKKAKLNKKINYNLLEEPIEYGLIKKLSLFGEIVLNSGNNYNPSFLVRYLIELSHTFNEFYHLCNVLKSEKDLMVARLAIVSATKQVLSNGLKILDLKPLEEM